MLSSEKYKEAGTVNAGHSGTSGRLKVLGDHMVLELITGIWSHASPAPGVPLFIQGTKMSRSLQPSHMPGPQCRISRSIACGLRTAILDIPLAYIL